MEECVHELYYFFNIQLCCFMRIQLCTLCVYIGERKQNCEVSMEIIKSENSEVIDWPCVLNSSQVIFSIEVFCCAVVF